MASKKKNPFTTYGPSGFSSEYIRYESPYDLILKKLDKIEKRLDALEKLPIINLLKNGMEDPEEKR